MNNNLITQRQRCNLLSILNIFLTYKIWTPSFNGENRRKTTSASFISSSHHSMHLNFIVILSVSLPFFYPSRAYSFRESLLLLSYLLLIWPVTFLSFDVKCSMFVCSFSRISSFISYLRAQLNPVKPIFHSTVVHILASNIDSRSIEWSYHFILIHLPPFYSPSHFVRRSFRNADSIHSVYRIPARSDDRRQVDSREVLRTLRSRKIRELRWIPCCQGYEFCIIFQSLIF